MLLQKYLHSTKYLDKSLLIFFFPDIDRFRNITFLSNFALETAASEGSQILPKYQATTLVLELTSHVVDITDYKDRQLTRLLSVPSIRYNFLSVSSISRTRLPILCNYNQAALASQTNTWTGKGIHLTSFSYFQIKR